MKRYKFVLYGHARGIKFGRSEGSFAAAEREVIFFFKLLLLELDVIPAKTSSSERKELFLLQS